MNYEIREAKKSRTIEINAKFLFRLVPMQRDMRSQMRTWRIQLARMTIRQNK